MAKRVTKPKVNLNCVADRAAFPHERIIELSDPKAGCLASIETFAGGMLVSMYRPDGVVIVGVPDIPDYPFVPFPTYHDVKVTGAKFGRYQATGTFDVTLLGDGKASVSTHAHVNDSRPAVTCNGADYLVNHLHLDRDPDTREWAESSGRGRYDITRRSFDDKPVAPMVRGAIVLAAVAAVESVWTVDRNVEAVTVKARQRAHRAHDDYVKARDALRVAGSDLREAIEDIELHSSPTPESFR